MFLEFSREISQNHQKAVEKQLFFLFAILLIFEPPPPTKIRKFRKNLKQAKEKQRFCNFADFHVALPPPNKNWKNRKNLKQAMEKQRFCDFAALIFLDFRRFSSIFLDFHR
jgi:hypothetical protein